MIRVHRLEHWWLTAVVAIFIFGVLIINGQDIFDRFGRRDLDPVLVLSQNFIHGELGFSSYIHDSAIFHGKYYWPLGPLPAILILPQVILGMMIGSDFPSATLHTFAVVATFFFVWRLARTKNFSRHDACWLSIAFCGTSIFLGVAVFPISWYTAHVVTVALVMVAFLEFHQRKRWWLIGILFAGVLLTRLTAWIGILFFILTIIFTPDTWRARFRNAIYLCIPFIVALIVLFFYNYFRFGYALEMGYRFQQLDAPALTAAREYGMFSFTHLAGNLYYLFFAPLNPVFADNQGISHVLRFPYLSFNPWGLSIFFTSPYFLLLFMEKKVLRTREQCFLLITTVAIAIPLLLYYGIGYFQYGYRYALDFLPFLFMMILNVFSARERPLSTRFKILITFSFFLQLFLLFVYKYELAL